MNGEQPPQQPVPQQPQPVKVKIPCMNCHQEMEVAPPMPRIFNAIDVSTICFVHVRPDICPHCRAMYLPIVEGFDETGGILFKWTPVKGQRAPVIVGGTNDTLRQAIENANLAHKIKTEGN